MPIPFLVPGLIAAGSAAAAAVGLGKGASAIKKNKQAKSINANAKASFEKAKASAEHARKESNTSLEKLGSTKLNVLDKTMNQFVSTFEKIHNITLTGSAGIDELSKFHLDKQELQEIRELGTMATSVVGGLLGGVGAGALTAFGAYGATMTFAAASTGTAIASLSGVAATNATLAFLGGGALAAGGGGMALGSTILGGAVAGPAVAILGVVMDASASKNLDKAKANMWKAEEAAEELKTVQTLCKGISKRADMFRGLLTKLDEVLKELTIRLGDIIRLRGIDYGQYTEEEQGIVAMALSVAGAIKQVLDTPILSEDGSLTLESKTTQDKVEKLLSAVVSTEE